jgi:sulfur carrier protein ThiS
MRLIIERPKGERELLFSGTVEGLLARCGFDPESVLVVRDATLLTRTDTVEDTDTITLLSVISGG